MPLFILLLDYNSNGHHILSMACILFGQKIFTEEDEKGKVPYLETVAEFAKDCHYYSYLQNRPRIFSCPFQKLPASIDHVAPQAATCSPREEALPELEDKRVTTKMNVFGRAQTVAALTDQQMLDSRKASAPRITIRGLQSTAAHHVGHQAYS